MLPFYLFMTSFGYPLFLQITDFPTIFAEFANAIAHWGASVFSIDCESVQSKLGVGWWQCTVLRLLPTTQTFLGLLPSLRSGKVLWVGQYLTLLSQWSARRWHPPQSKGVTLTLTLGSWEWFGYISHNVRSFSPVEALANTPASCSVLLANRQLLPLFASVCD